MRNKLFVGLFALVASLGCAVPFSTPPTTTPLMTTPLTTPTPPLPPTTEPTAQALPEAEGAIQFEGQLVVVGVDGNLYLADGQTGEITSLTDTEDTRAYRHPTWSPSGWLSYVRVEAEGGLEVVAQRPGETEPRSMHQTDDDNYIYGYWSPTACSSGTDCGRFTFLMGERGGIGFYLGEVNQEGETSTATRLRQSDSHYWSWAPDGNQMVWFRDGEELSVYDVDSETITEEFEGSFGVFQAPSWSPIDERLLYSSRMNDDGFSLTYARDETDAALDVAVELLSAFSWSPTGEYIAYSTGRGFPLEQVGIARSDGSSTQVIDLIPNALSFFWSPDGATLAVVAIEAPRNDVEVRRFSRPIQQEDEGPVLVWYLVEPATGDVLRAAEFLPTAEQLYILQFFDQYAQSHRVWSADSRYISYAEVLPESDEARIRLIDTAQPGRAPIDLMAGQQAIFSFD